MPAALSIVVYKTTAELQLRVLAVTVVATNLVGMHRVSPEHSFTSTDIFNNLQPACVVWGAPGDHSGCLFMQLLA